MAKPLGLRTEIIINLILLMVAALLCSSVLLLKLAERELVLQRQEAAVATMKILAGFMAALPRDDEAGMRLLLERADRLLAQEGVHSDMQEWGVVDQNLAPLLSPYRPDLNLQLELEDLAESRRGRNTVIRSFYEPFLLPWQRRSAGSLRITEPLLVNGNFVGSIQARFSFERIADRIGSVYRVLLLNMALFGAILVGFGFFLLGRTVVRPIRTLLAATRRVAAGDLQQSLVLQGPDEIALLGQTFNAMTGSLQKSRQETDRTILSLQQANQQLRTAQAELVRSEKLASVGRLAAGMAHEIGNPLGALTGYLDYLRSEAGSAADAKVLERARAEAGRIDRLVRDLLDYAVPGQGEGEPVPPVATIREALELLGGQGALDQVQLVVELPAELPPVFIARHKLVQVLVNLILNGRDAAPAGTLTVRAGCDATAVWIEIADDGAGMDEDLLRQIHDPFFTTKCPGQGRGLGLTVCHHILEECGGRLLVRSAPGAGSCFRVLFPSQEG